MCLDKMSALPEDPPASLSGAPEVRRWREALADGAFGVWDLDVPAERVHYPAAWKQRLGFPRPEAADDTGFWRCRVHPEDFIAMLQALQGHAQGDRPTYEAVFRLRSNGSGYRTMRSRGQVVARDAQGQPLRIVGTMVDLTPRPITPQGRGLPMDDGRFAAPAGAVPLHQWIGLPGPVAAVPSPGATGAFVGADALSGNDLVAGVGDLIDRAWREACAAR
jgi:hypothetical protein